MEVDKLVILLGLAGMEVVFFVALWMLYCTLYLWLKQYSQYAELLAVAKQCLPHP